MTISIEWLLGIFFALVCGNYAFTAGIALWLSGKIDKVVSNHIKHLADRVGVLEKKESECPYKEGD